MADILQTLNPQWPDEELDPEAARRLKQKFPMKALPSKMKPLPTYKPKAGGKTVNEVDMSMKVDFSTSALPDI